MNLKLKRTLEFFAIVLVTVVVALSSPLNPWANNVFTDVQNDILSIAHSVKEGYLAYVELDGHYGPVVYEFYGLGYLLTETHIVQFVMETVVVFFTVLYMYKTAKLYTSEIFAFITTALLSVRSRHRKSLSRRCRPFTTKCARLTNTDSSWLRPTITTSTTAPPSFAWARSG